ncbi:MAG: gfo/Idh/MocA family oxidoreductase, partial [Candidatus Brockarchaeota archaeon]|nr:gfo/Idh/MocA family oxidoreductase [Candidatus Brockarchaeota archaeon]
DAFAAVLEFENGAIGTFEASRFATGRKNYNNFEINGEKGSIEFNLERLNELRFYSAEGEAKVLGWSEVLVTDKEHPYISHYWPAGHIIGWEHTFINEVYHFVDAIVNDKKVEPYGATFEDGYRNAVILDAILESAETGKRVTIHF